MLMVDMVLTFTELNSGPTPNHGWINTVSNDTEVAQGLKTWFSGPIHSAITGPARRLASDVRVVSTRLIKIVLGQRPTTTLVNIDRGDSNLRWGVLVVPFPHPEGVPHRFTTQPEPFWRAGIALGTLPAWLQTHMINLSR